MFVSRKLISSTWFVAALFVPSIHAQTFFVTSGGTVKAVATNGTTTSLASGYSTLDGLAVDSAGNVYVGEPQAHKIWKITPDGVASSFGDIGGGPMGLTFDGSGNLYVATNSELGGFAGVSRIAPDGAVTRVKGGLNFLYDLTLDTSGNIFTADITTGQIYRITPDGTTTNFASVGSAGPISLTFSGSGDLFTSNWYGNTYSRIAPDGTVSLLYSAGSAGVAHDLIFGTNGSLLVPGGHLALDGTFTAVEGNLWSGARGLAYSTSAIPEPSTYAAIVGGFALVGAMIWRRRRAHGCGARG